MIIVHNSSNNPYPINFKVYIYHNYLSNSTKEVMEKLQDPYLQIPLSSAWGSMVCSLIQKSFILNAKKRWKIRKIHAEWKILYEKELESV